MNDQLNESISALVDGETDDLELRRLLNQLEHAGPAEAQALRARWASYHRLGAALRGESAAAVDEGFSARVASAIAQLDSPALDSAVIDDAAIDSAVNDTSPSAAAGQGSVQASGAELAAVPAWKRLAVAASVTVAVLVGYQQLSVDQASPAASLAVAPPVASPQGGAGELATLDSSAAAAVSTEQAALAQQRLNEYLLRHTSHAASQSGQGMIPFARLANFEEE